MGRAHGVGDPSLVEGGGDPLHPPLAQGRDALRQTRAQCGQHLGPLGVECDRRRRRHDRPQLAQRGVLSGVPGHGGTVLPCGQVDDRPEFLGHGHQWRLGHLGATLGPGARVLLLDGLTHGRDPTAQELLGHRQLLGPELGQCGVAVDGRRRRTAVAALGPLAAATTGPGRAGPPGATRGATGRRRTLPAASLTTGGTVTVGPRASGTVAAWTATRGPAGAVPVVPVVVAAALALSGEDDVDVGALLWRTDDLDPVDGPGLGLALGCEECGHRGAIECGLDLRPQDGARGGAGGYEPGVHGAPWELGARGAPRPRGLVRLAGEFDFDSMAHTGGQATAKAGPHGPGPSGTGATADSPCSSTDTPPWRTPYAAGDECTAP